MKRSELFERALASADERKSIDDLVNEFISLYCKAKKQVRIASAYFSNPGGPLLAGGPGLHEAVNPTSRKRDLYWAEEAKGRGEEILSDLKDKYNDLLDEIKIRRARGVKIAWNNEEVKEKVEDLLNKADDYSTKAKEVRQLSIEMDKVKDAVKNLLKSHKLIQ